MHSDTSLLKENFVCARTPEELIAWIEPMQARFHAEGPAKDYAGTEEKRLVKASYEEIMPLGDLARHKYHLGRPGFLLRPKIGDQNYDAELIDTSAGYQLMQRVEFTSTHRGHDLAFRLEHLARHGEAFLTGPVSRDGNRQVQIQPGFVDHQILLDNLMATRKERVANKLGYDYAPGTLLAIVFDESILYSEDIPSITQYFRDALSKQALNEFCGGFILGAAGRIFLEFGKTDS